MFYKILKISSCRNCREHYVVAKFPAEHHIAKTLIFSGLISLQRVAAKLILLLEIQYFLSYIHGITCNAILKYM